MTDDRQDVAESLDDDKIGDDPVANVGGDDLRALHQQYPPDELLGADDRVEEQDSLAERATVRRWREGEGSAIRLAGEDLLDDEPQLVVSEWDTATNDPSAEESALHETDPPPLRGSDSYLSADDELLGELDDVEVDPSGAEGLDEAPREFEEPDDQRAG